MINYVSLLTEYKKDFLKRKQLLIANGVSFTNDAPNPCIYASEIPIPSFDIPDFTTSEYQETLMRSGQYITKTDSQQEIDIVIRNLLAYKRCKYYEQRIFGVDVEANNTITT